MNTVTTPRYCILLSNQVKPQSSISDYSAGYLSFRETLPSPLNFNTSLSQPRFNFKQQKVGQELQSPRSITEHSRPLKLQKNYVHLLMRKNSIAGSQLENEYNPCEMRKPLIISCSRQILKPKIYFSYNRYTSKDTNIKLINSNYQFCGSECNSSMYTVNLKLFQRKLSKNQKQKKLKITSSVFYFIYTPKNQNKIQAHQSFIYQLQNKNQTHLKGSSTSINAVSYIQNNGESFSKEAKSSKMASTQITQSFSMDSRRFDFSSTKETEALRSLQKYDENNHKSAQNIFSHDYTLPSLLESLSPSKNLKKTVIQNNYNFGGIFLREPETHPSSAQKATLQPTFKEQNQVWKKLMSGLFREEVQDDNLKKSIYCGPQKRHQSLRCDILSGFGRQMAESKVCPDQ